ncbi:hypothetical protein BDZ89DRAFT_754239 [Hymenopellis radicata]|nr:hypothetical protein BDZ89DRAFT_754239 [Hymenopellis radicata]
MAILGEHGKAEAVFLALLNATKISRQKRTQRGRGRVRLDLSLMPISSEISSRRRILLRIHSVLCLGPSIAIVIRSIV